MNYHAISPSSPIQLPLYLSQVPAGFPSPADDYVETSLDLQKLLVKHPAATFLVKAKGSSMDPLIHNGDLLVVDRSIEPKHGHIVIPSLNGDLTVKQMFKRRGIVSLLPENKDFSPIDVTTGFEFQVWGVVTYVVRDTCIS